MTSTGVGLAAQGYHRVEVGGGGGWDLRHSVRLAGRYRGVQCPTFRAITVPPPQSHPRPPLRPSLPPPRCRSNFYGRLKDLRDYHRRFPDDDITEVKKGRWPSY